MGFVDNILAPMIQLFIYGVLVLWFIFMVYWIQKTLFPNFRWILKYTILRRPYKEKDVEWCLDAIDRGKSVIRVKRFLLIKGTSMSRTKELIFILKKVNMKLKKLEGGEDNGRKFRQSDEEFKEIPKVKS